MKIICMTKYEPEIKKITDEMIEIEKFYKNKAEFMWRQLLALKDECNEKIKPLWKDIEARLNEQNMIPKEYNKDEHHLYFNDEEGAIYMKNDHEMDFAKLMEHMKK